MSIIFDNDKLTEFIEEFVSTVPRILRSNPITADLSGKIERLSDEIDAPFSLAVVGQMRIGKSSLMNGLIGKKLAVVGVNETTATINLFKYGQGDFKDIFRVHWKNRHFEDFPRADIDKWIGESDHASLTRFIEFFDDNDFFKEITLVDTPGTRSVIDDHNELINSFLAEKREKETLRHGAKADAVLYVTGAVANATAEEMLKDFQENTRLPGSSPFNSVAVLHKWEILEVDNPHEEAYRKANLMEQQFEQFVAKVIPVSGPLALASRTLEDAFWEKIIHLVQNHDESLLLKILDRGDARFKKRIENGEELLLQSGLPWACFRIIVKHASQNGIKEGRCLREEVLKLSGIEQLMDFIQQRFIEKSSQIKSLTALAKAVEPCQIAQLRLQNDISYKEKLLDDAVQCSTMMDNYITKEHEFLEPVSRYIRVSQKPFRGDLERHKATQAELGEKASFVEQGYNQIINDLKALELSDSDVEIFSYEEQREIRHICGGYGLSVIDRTACYADNSRFLLETVEEKIEYWDNKEDGLATALKPVARHMVSRLEELVQELEKSDRDYE